MVNAHCVADEECVEVKRQQTAHALAQPRRIIHHFFAQKAKPPWGITDYGISHYEQLPLRAVESHFARGFSRHTYRDQRVQGWPKFDVRAGADVAPRLTVLADRTPELKRGGKCCRSK